LRPTLPIGSISFRANWHFLLLFVLAPFWLGASLAKPPQAEVGPSDERATAQEFSGNGALGDPLSVDQGTPDVSEAKKFALGKSNLGAALFTHPTCNLLSALAVATERSAGLLYSFNAIVSSSTARGPPSRVCS